jgi:hypothetical protein
MSTVATPPNAGEAPPGAHQQALSLPGPAVDPHVPR